LTGNRQIKVRTYKIPGPKWKYVPGVVIEHGIFEDDFHGATTPGAAEIKKLIAVVGPGGNYLPVPMSFPCLFLFIIGIID
jgi:hypothetical protein